MPTPRKIFHAVQVDQCRAENIDRIQRAMATWNVLYQHCGVVPAHMTSYSRSSKGIGDQRDLPYLKDVLLFAMSQADKEDIIMFSNDDNCLHPLLPDYLRYHVALFGACAAFRYESQVPIQISHTVKNGAVALYPSTHSAGQDLFVFTKAWLESHWNEIPDFLLGASEWDWCLTMIIRKEKGIHSTQQSMRAPIFPAEIPLGYVGHESHKPGWIEDTVVNAAPSQVHNKKLFADWLAVNNPSFKMNVYRGVPPADPRTTVLKSDGTTRFYHSGNLGDIIYALPAIRAIGGGSLIVGPQQRGTARCDPPTTREQFDMLLPLLKLQNYISGVEYSDTYPDGEFYDFNRFRNTWVNSNYRHGRGIDTLCKCHFFDLGIIDSFSHSNPWIYCDNHASKKWFVIHRSPRYNAPGAGPESFPWKVLLSRHSEHMLFIGLESEWRQLQTTFGVSVAFHKCSDFLEMARIIAASRCFIGNQSFPLSLALGMRKSVRCEAYPPSPDCRFDRENYADQLNRPRDCHLFNFCV